VSGLLALTWTFLWLSLLCVGGGLSVVPEMERQVVNVHAWITARQFVDGYTLSQLTPGPTMLVAVFVGYAAHGVAGGVLAGAGMFLPTSVLAVVVAARWRRVRSHRWVEPVEHALAPIGIGLMAGGVYTLARSALHDTLTVALAVGGTAVLLAKWAPPIVVVLAAGAIAWLAGG
jgi:chromate transporter